MADPRAEPTGDRRAEIAANLADFDQRVKAACDSCGRDPAGLTLIAVTKTFPAADVRLVAQLGVHDVGENRDQEAVAKHAECAELPLRWHFIGRLQTNKCRSVAGYADMVHSVDRARVVDALSTASVESGRMLTALVQVSLDPEGSAAGRGGAAPNDVLALADRIEAAPGLSLGGVMAVAPLGADADLAFSRLADVAASLVEAHPGATVRSAGMSGDLEAAIRHGATHLRVGTALLGRRSGLVG